MFRSEIQAILRAALITLALAIHGLAAAPLPHTVTKEDMRSPVTQEEIARWSERLTALGYPIGREELGRRVVAVSRVIGGTHRAALAPFRPLFRWTGTGQSWALFSNPDIYPSRLEIRIRRQGQAEWEPLYRRLDPEHDWADDLLSYRRVRGIYDTHGNAGSPRAPYRRFAQWIGRRILDAHPTVEEVEVRVLRTHTTLRGQPPDGRIEIRHAIQVRRDP